MKHALDNMHFVAHLGCCVYLVINWLFSELLVSSNIRVRFPVRSPYFKEQTRNSLFFLF